jgi:NAD-dependent deacetylase
MFESVTKKLRDARKIVFVTGAGISHESGIPTFRGKDGLWRNYDAMKLATVNAFYGIMKEGKIFFMQNQI